MNFTAWDYQQLRFKAVLFGICFLLAGVLGVGGAHNAQAYAMCALLFVGGIALLFFASFCSNQLAKIADANPTDDRFAMSDLHLD